jgi:RecB family exonuclease
VPFSVLATPYGRPAAERLAAQVHEGQGRDPFAPVTVVVPATYAGIAARRRLARDGVVAVTFLTMSRLAERLAGPALAAAGRRPESPPVVLEAVRRVLRERPGLFGPVADHPATEAALAAAHAELRGVSDAALDAVAASSDRSADVVAIHRAVSALLRARWHDEYDLIAAAADALERPGAVEALGTVIVHLPQRVAPATARLLGALAARATVLVNVGLSGEPAADAVVRAALARAGVRVPDPAWSPPLAHAIVTVTDPDEEVRAAVRAIVDAARGGVPLARMAVVWGAADPYARLVDAQLGAAGIPVNGTPLRTVGDSVAGRTVRALLALPERGFRRADVMGLLAGAPVLAGRRPVPNRAWERIARDAGVVDAHDWDVRLAAHQARLEELAREAEADERDAMAADRRADARRAGELAAFVAGLRDRVGEVSAAADWAQLADRTAALLRSTLGPPGRRQHWPPEEQRAADRVEVALEALGGLDVVGGPPPDVDVFRRSLDASLDAALRRAGRFGEGVLVGPLSVVTGLELDRLVVLGLAEGTLPAARLEDSLLPDADRRAAAGELRLAADAAQEERHRFLAAVAAADHVTLTFPRGDLRRQGERVASRWLLQTVAARAGVPAVATGDLAGFEGVEHVPSFAAGISRLRFPATAQEHRLRRLLADPGGGLPLDAVFAAGVELTRARASAAFTRFDGNLAGVGVSGPAEGSITSATRLESWVACPYRYFAEVVLGIAVPEDPERSLVMTALDRGSLVHEILDRFVAGSVAGDPVDQARLASITDQVFAASEAMGATGRDLFWRRDQGDIRRDLAEFLQRDRARSRDGALEPLCTEFRFGATPGGPPPVELPLAGGGAVRFRGAADRIDGRPDGALVVIDYKTGKRDTYVGLSPEDPTRGMTRFQLPVYALAARAATGRPDAPVEAAYWFVTERGQFSWIGYRVTDDVLSRAGAAVGTVAALITAGAFPALPRPDVWVPWVECEFCDPDGLGTGDRRREWERKRQSPELAAVAELFVAR